MSAISWDDFARVDIRLGTIVEAAPFPDADGEVCLVTVVPAAPSGGRLF